MRRGSFVAGLAAAFCLILGAAIPGAAQDREGDGGTATRKPNLDLDYAQVRFVRASREISGAWSFAVTVRHRDEGWEHYADAWQVVDPETGAVIAERVLAHPHENEQPFTRSLGGVRIPPEISEVLVRARCNRHGFGGREILVDLERSAGEGFEVSAR